MYKALFIADAVQPTGFSRVLHSILEYLPKDLYDIHILGVNYYGDPHEYPYKIYPAYIGGDVYGYNRVQNFADQSFDLIFILNDIWIVGRYLEKIKESFKKFPKIVSYSPVDSLYPNPVWFNEYDIVSQVVTYTEYGKKAIEYESPYVDVEVIPHGVDTKYFHRLEGTKQELKGKIYPKRDDFLNSFIVLNANRNQPRKRHDLSMEAFKLFAEDKPLNVKYYHHAGLKDMGIDIIRKAQQLGIDGRIILTNAEQNTQKVPIEYLNLIYNATDVGVNTSLGEGWGLVSVEHAVTGAPQIVPDHSALPEVFGDIGLYEDTIANHTFETTCTVGRVPSAESIAEQFEKLYADQNLYNELSQKGIERFSSEEFSWKKISNTWNELFLKVLED